MYKILEQCIGELRVNHTDRDVTEMVHGLFQIAKDAAREYTDDVTVAQLRADRPELAFMDDDEIGEILEQAKTIRYKKDPQRYHTDGYDKEEKWRPVSLREAAEMREIHKEGAFVLFPTDDTRRIYERQTLEEFVKDCKFFIGE